MDFDIFRVKADPSEGIFVKEAHLSIKGLSLTVYDLMESKLLADSRIQHHLYI